jgi:WD40 repeat protein
VTKLAFVPWNSSVVASVSEDTAVKVFSVTDQSTIYSSSQHTDYVHGVSWHPCKPCFLTCGWDGQLLLHSLEKPSADTPVDMETSKDCSISDDHEQ